MKLTPIERRWTLAILDAMFPRNASDDLPLGILDLEVATYLEDTFAKVPKVSGIGMRVGFVAIALSPPVTIGKLGPIDRLDARDRVGVMEKLYQSPIHCHAPFGSGAHGAGFPNECGGARLLHP